MDRYLGGTKMKKQNRNVEISCLRQGCQGVGRESIDKDIETQDLMS